MVHYLHGVHADVFTDYKSLQCGFSQKELNLKQRSCLELLKDYDMSILYHPSKANVVVDVLIKYHRNSIAHVEEGKKQFAKSCTHLHN